MPELSAALDWEAKARAVLHDVLLEDFQPALSRLEELQASPKPVVAARGVFSTGKSALIKRLLVEHELPVPPWLTVGGARETSDIHDVDLGPVILRDAPGTNSGIGALSDELHSDRADEAIEAADAILILLPANLMTDDRDRTLELISGSFFNPSRKRLPALALTLLIARLEEIGGSPDDDPDGFRRRIDDKRRELQELLEQAGAGIESDQILTVAADPFEVVEDARDITPSDYEHADWDGVGSVLARLKAIGGAFDDLRLAAERRFLERQLTLGGRRVSQRLEMAGQALAEATEAEDERARLASALDALLNAASATLRARVKDEIISIARSPAVSSERIGELLNTRLGELIDSWSNEQLVEVRRLGLEGEDVAGPSTGASVLDDLLSGLAGDSKPAGPDLQYLEDLRSQLLHLMDAAALMRYGRSLEELRAAYRDRAPGTGGTSSQAGAGEQPQSGQGDAEFDLARIGAAVEGAVIALNAAVTIYSLWEERRAEEEREKAVAERSERILELADQLSNTIANRVMNGHDDAPGWRAWAEAQFDEAVVDVTVKAVAAEAMRSEVAELERIRTAIDELLRER